MESTSPISSSTVTSLVSLRTASGFSNSICSLESVVQTPKTRMPAARAAATPAGASSMTTQLLGSAPRALAAARNASGAGLSRSNASAVTTASK